MREDRKETAKSTASLDRIRHDTRMNILVVEDEDAIAAPLVEGLQREGYQVSRVATGADALAAPLPDLFLLDLRLPDMDGYDICRQIRTRSDVPIIMVTARGEETDRVIGLELGADDYIVKPFGVRELIARIRAVTRRTSNRPDTSDGIQSGALEVDIRGRRALVNGQELPLTTKEFDLLTALASDPGVVVSRKQLLQDVWDTTWYGSTKTIDVHIASLRKKLGTAVAIETVRGIGFRLRSDAE